MRNVRVTGRSLMLVGALLALASAEAAQRTFVASTGNDANPCSLAQPCRGFAAALNQTDVGGEIVVIDSAGYGVFTTDRSVSVIAPPGVHAGVSVFSPSNGITVDGPGAKVVLRGLSINGQGGAIGIWMRNGTELHVEIELLGPEGVPLGRRTVFTASAHQGMGAELAPANTNYETMIVPDEIRNGLRREVTEKLAADIVKTVCQVIGERESR